MLLFLEWAKEKNITADLQWMSFEEIDQVLRQFYAEAHSKDGKPYSRSTLLALRNGIERYLSLPAVNRPIKFSQDPRFVLSNKMLDATLKQLKREGKENTRHKPPIESKDILTLKSHEALSIQRPLSLLRNVWFHVTLFWCRRGCEGQRLLKKESFVFDKDGDGREFATMTHDECTKNHPGGVKDVESFEKLGRMYKTSSALDGYTALKVYLSKLNPDCSAFFQYPKRKWQPTDAIWFENRPLGQNKLSKMMKEISQEAGLSQQYTNHSVRATAITLWSNAGLSNRQIMAISGHKNEASLRSYNSRPSTNQLQQCSDVLSLAIGDAPEESRAVCPYTQPENSGSVQLSRQDLNLAQASMFSGCKINNVHISFNR